MKHINTYELFLENNPNTPQGYLSALSKKPKLKPNQQKPTDDVDDILQNTEEQKQKILIKKDTIEKGDPWVSKMKKESEVEAPSDIEELKKESEVEAPSDIEELKGDTALTGLSDLSIN